MTFSMIEVKTRWIDEAGNDSSPNTLFGRSDDSIAHFLLHTMGWVRISHFGQTYDVTFDPRSVRPGAADSLTAWVRQMGDTDQPWLIKLHAFTGRGWIIEDNTMSEPLLKILAHLLEFGMTPNIPETISVTESDMDSVPALQTSDIQAVMDAWRREHGTMRVDNPLVRSLLRGQVTGRSVKILSRDNLGRICFNTYNASSSTLWNNGTLVNFHGAPVVEAVPDRALGSTVDRSARKVMARGVPTVEYCQGPVLSSQGVVADLCWHRLTVPLSQTADNDTVLVITQRQSPVTKQVAV